MDDRGGPRRSADGADQSTLADVRPPGFGPRRALHRRAGIGLLVLVVAAGAAGLLGVRSGTVTGSGGGYDLTLTYPRIARAGLDVPWRIHVHRADRFRDQVTISITAPYLDLLDSEGFMPEPSTQTADARRNYLTFDPPRGTDLVVDYMAHIRPSRQLGGSGQVAVLVAGRPAVTVGFTTWLVP